MIATPSKLGIAVAVLWLVSSACLASAGVQTFFESFNDGAFRDDAFTTARWDTVAGTLGLPPFAVASIGSYNTTSYSYAVAVSGDYAYIADYAAGLVVVDISDPGYPAYVAAYNTPGVAYDVAVYGDYAFVADGGAGVQIIDIANPASPAFVGNYNTAGDARGVVVDGDYAFVADNTSHLLVVLNISNPASPTLAGSYNTTGYPMEVAVSGDFAYVVDTAGSRILDIRNPASITLVGTFSTPGSDLGIEVAGDYAYFADGSAGLSVFYIGNPANPTYVGGYNTPGTAALDVALAGEYAYVLEEATGLHVVDITTPSMPQLIQSCDIPGVLARAVTVVGDHAFIANFDLGLNVVEVADRLTDGGLLMYRGYGGDVWGNAIWVDGDYAFVADRQSTLVGLRIFQLANPVAPGLVGTCPALSLSQDVAVAGHYAYVTDQFDGLYVVDISSPWNPTMAGSCDTPGFSQGLAVAGNYAFIADDTSLQIINISLPAMPMPAGSCVTGGEASDVAVAGDYAFVANGSAGLAVVSIVNPASPVLVGSCDTPGSAVAVAIDGNYAFVADFESGMQVIDISNPALPVLASSFNNPPGRSVSIAVEGDYAYLGDDMSGVWIIDVSDPDGYIGADWPCYTYGSPMGIAVAGDYAYVANGLGGIAVVEVAQRKVQRNANIGQSLSVCGTLRPLMARLSAENNGSITWYLNADAGHDTSWVEVTEGTWVELVDRSGGGLRWRSRHNYPGYGGSSLCDELTLDWLDEFPAIDVVSDVANDQGRQVRIVWTRSGLDALHSPKPITEYAVFRRVDPLSAPEGGEPILRGDPAAAYPAYPPGDWDFVKTVPAYCEQTYSTVVPTLADSTAEETHRTVFFIRAATASPGVYYDAPPDSGVSIDNLAPAPPANLRMSSPIALAWDESEDADFDYFTVYGSPNSELDPAATRIGHTSGTGMNVSGERYAYYHVTATDFSGNEGEASSVENTATSVPDAAPIPATFALGGAWPNPLGRSTSVFFDLPVESPVRLEVFDTRGRRVRTLADRVYPAGRHRVSWTADDDRGQALGAGIYFLRMQAGTWAGTGKVLLMR